MEDSNVCVSIGLPVYNGEAFLSEALESILAQTFKDFELIISDNASTDATPKICQEFASRDDRIRYYRNDQNVGAAPNYNLVYSLSKGKYFKWATHDDVIAPDFLEQCVRVLEEDLLVSLAYPRTVVIDEHNGFLESYSNKFDICSPKPHERFKSFYNRMTSGLERCEPVFGLIRSSCLSKTPLIGSYISSDRVLLAELSLLGKFSEVPENLFFKRNHPGTSMQACFDFNKRIRWFNPNVKGKLLFARWRLFLEYINAINRVDMSWQARKSCIAIMIRWFMRDRQGYMNELIINAARFFNINSINVFGINKILPGDW